MTALDMTFLDQKNKLARALGDADTDSESLWPNADREYELNAGEVQFAEDSKSLLRKVTGTVASQKIDLPSGFLGIHVLIVDDVALTNDHEVPLADWERFEDSGDDKYYFWTDTSNTRQINFFDSSTNGLSYTLFYFGLPTTVLSADGDKSPFVNRYRKASVYYAAKELLTMAGKTQMAAYYENEYNKIVLRAQEDTEKLVKSVIKAMPDIAPANMFDKDKQGVGAFPGPGFID